MAKIAGSNYLIYTPVQKAAIIENRDFLRSAVEDLKTMAAVNDSVKPDLLRAEQALATADAMIEIMTRNDKPAKQIADK